MIDIDFQNHGSICVIFGRTPEGQAWLADNVNQGDETQQWAGGIVVEPRYVSDIAEGALAEGLDISLRGA